MVIKASYLLKKPEKEFPQRLSVSKVKTFDSCKAKFKYSYIEKLPRKDWEHLTFGKLLHAVLEEYHKQRLNGDAREAHELMSSTYNDEIGSWTVTNSQKNECIDILQKYIQYWTELEKENKAPTILSVEKNFFIDIEGQVLLNGFIDVVQRDPDGILHVADYKTSSAAGKSFLKKDEFQLLTYAYVMFLENPEVEVVRGSYILLRHDFESYIWDFKREDVMEKIGSKFIQYAKDISEEKLYRPKTSRLCSYCDYISSCEAGKIEVFGDTTYGKSPW